MYRAGRGALPVQLLVGAVRGLTSLLVIFDTIPDTADPLTPAVCVTDFMSQHDWSQAGIAEVRALYQTTAAQLGLVPGAFNVPSLVVSFCMQYCKDS